MYFSIDYKFIFVYEASLSSREVGGGSNTLRGPSISASILREGGDIYSPRDPSMDGRVGSQQGCSGSQPHRGGHQFEYFFIQFVQICLHVFFLIYKILYIDAEVENVPNVGQKRFRVECFIQEEGCPPTTTYPADISNIPWERKMEHAP